MPAIAFRPLTLADGQTVRQHVCPSDNRNCDLNFMNLMSWRFLYDTEMAIHGSWLLFRFQVDGHPAYLAPVGRGDWREVLRDLVDDAAAQSQPFLMLGVCEQRLSRLNEAFPDYFYATADRDYTDYIYTRESLATLSGKKLQPKRNHANRFERLYPDYRFVPLTPDLFPECLRLEEKWAEEKPVNSTRRSYASEQRSMQYVLSHWEALEGRGGALLVGDRLIAFTFGSPINHDTFDICVEKADTEYDGAFTVINRDFARSLPTRYTYINREEDLGISGLRKAKLSYHPAFLLHKYAIMAKHPLGR